MYTVKEIYFTLQGEGAQAGRPAVFCRFTGCNLWSGREQDRAKAICQFCDTDFVGHDGPGGGRFKGAAALSAACSQAWVRQESHQASPLVVLTGGEPMLQVNEVLIEALHASGFEVAIESNGTLPVLPSIDWICVSPKAGAELVQKSGDELKLVYPQAGITPEDLEGCDFTRFFLQPMDGPGRNDATQAAISYSLDHPRWQVSLQTHKLIDIP